MGGLGGGLGGAWKGSGFRTALLRSASNPQCHLDLIALLMSLRSGIKSFKVFCLIGVDE